ncbi:MAG TPA: PAC2 family protein [Candidatus Tectomicrobia bacterium]|nr:PAC2 family protein [Candidatus Tectomicrobia bacterium]
MDPLIIDQHPSLRQPVLILAFAGWNDAGEAATSAAQFLCSRLNAEKFASLEPEEFYNFAELRPRVRLVKGQREIVWPANEFFYVQDPSLVQDLVIGVGIEPHLKWKTYIKAILDLAHQCEVGMVLTLGALLAEVVYSRPVRITGSSTDPELTARLHLSTSRYEGPTGIVGILNDACRREGLPAVSLWANVPHYLSNTPNPKAMYALVRRVLGMLDHPIDLNDVETAVRDFESKVAEVIANNPAVASYVRQLEEREPDEGEEAPSRRESELPSGDQLVQELEQFLRQQRRDKPSE